MLNKCISVITSSPPLTSCASDQGSFNWWALLDVFASQWDCRCWWKRDVTRTYRFEFQPLTHQRRWCTLAQFGSIQLLKHLRDIMNRIQFHHSIVTATLLLDTLCSFYEILKNNCKLFISGEDSAHSVVIGSFTKHNNIFIKFLSFYLENLTCDMYRVHQSFVNLLRKKQKHKLLAGKKRDVFTVFKIYWPITSH